MSANVRRLVLDPAPLLQTCVGYGLWLLIAAMAAMWMTGHGHSNPMMIFSTTVATLTFVVKMKTWETLPASRWELGRAQWWYLLGRPYLLAIVSTGLAVGVDAAMGWLHVDWIAIAAFLGGELTLLALIGLALPLGAALAPVFGMTGSLVAFIVPFATALVLGFRWSLKGGGDIFQPEMLTGGAMALGVAVITYALSPWLPLARNHLLSQPTRGAAPSRAAASERPTSKRPTSKRPTSKRLASKRLASTRRSPAGSWAVFAPILNKGLRLVLLCAVAAVILELPPVRAMAGQAMPPDLFLFFLPLIGAVGAMTLTTTVPQRVLAGLPLSALARTVALVAVGPALQLPLAGIFIAAMTVGHPADYWLPQMGLTVLGGITLTALALPMTLRFGRKGPVMMIAAWVPLGVLSGVVMGLTMKGQDHSRLVLGVAAILVVLTVASWLWTWWEIAYGRAIYRQWAWQPVAWRGR